MQRALQPSLCPSGRNPPIHHRINLESEVTFLCVIWCLLQDAVSRLDTQIPAKSTVHMCELVADGAWSLTK